MRSLLLITLLACNRTTPNPSTTDPSTDDATTDEPFTLPDAEVVTFDTTDGVTLEADWYPSGSAGSPAVLLLHMIPPSNDRTGWPSSFVDRLREQRWSVLVIDRRGAGGSGGVAREAYEGPNGKLDVSAAVTFLQGNELGELAIIGASNGTTSMLDYTVWAAEQDLPVPVAVGFMSGGSYTENQADMSDMPAIPAVFTYPPSESGWPLEHTDLDPGTWQFLEYDGGSHGTRMFESKPRVRGDLVDFLAGVLPTG